MAFPVIIRAKKLATMGQIAASGAHTWRERPTPNADPERTPHNEDLRPVAGSVDLRAAVDARLATVTEKPAAKPVRCIEYLVTANHDAFREAGGQVDADAYLRDALRWIERKHGAANVVAANIQRDELTPHLVVYVVPLVETEARERKRSVIVGTNPDGTKRRETRTEQQQAGVRLSAAHYLDGRAKLSKLQTDFAADVGQRHGLARGVERSKAKHVTVREFYAGLAAAERPLPVISATVVQPRAYKPEGMAERLGLSKRVETPEEVAARLTAGMHQLMTPLATAAAGVAVERKKRQQAEATAQVKVAELDAVRPVVDALRGLSVDDVAKVVEQARGMQRAAQVAAEAARRAAALTRHLASNATSAVGRYARSALSAIQAAGDHLHVDWGKTDRSWAKGAMAGADGYSPLPMATVVQVQVEYSPGKAGMTPEERRWVIEEAQRQSAAHEQPGLARKPQGPEIGG